MTAALKTGFPVVPTPSFAVRPDPAACSVDAYFETSLSWVTAPASPAEFETPQAPMQEPTTELTRQLARVVAVTGWSSRDLEPILGTSHTTIQRLQRFGIASARSQRAALLVSPLFEVLERLAVVLPNPADLNLALSRQSRAGTTARDLFARERWAEGYAAALAATKGPRVSMLAPEPGRVRRPATREIR